jgi:hypothetical protein
MKSSEVCLAILSARCGWCMIVYAIAFASALAQSEKPVLAYHLTHVDTGEPFPSPDGKRIVFESKVAGYYQLFTMQPDGSDVRRSRTMRGTTTRLRGLRTAGSSPSSLIRTSIRLFTS